MASEQLGLSIHHLFISDRLQPSTSQLYLSDWRGLPIITVSAKDSNLHVGLDRAGKPFSLDAKLEGTGLRGRWLLLSPQYPADGPLVGRKVLTLPEWRPFEGVNRLQTAEGLLDLVGYLFRNAPVESFQEFQAFWNSEAEPIFYPVLDQFLYGSRELEEGLKQKQLRILYRFVRQSELSTYSTRFAESYRKVHRDLAQLFPKIEMKNLVVAMPPLEGVATLTQVVGGVYFTFVDVKDSRKFSSRQLPYFLARHILTTPLLAARHRHAVTLAEKLFQEGMLAYFSSKLGYSKDRSAYLLMPEEEIQKAESTSAQYGKEMETNLRSRDPDLLKRYFSDSPRCHPKRFWFLVRLRCRR